MRSSIEALASLLDGAVRRIGVAFAIVLLPILIAVTVFDVVGRQFGNVGSSRLQELEWYLFFGLIFMTFGWTYVGDGHVRIDILRARLSPRAQAWTEALGCAVLLVPACAMIVVYGAESAILSFEQGERSRAALGLPYRWIVKSLVPAGMGLLLLAGLAAFLRALLELSRPAAKRDARPAGPKLG
ncbi:MAG: TRAP transporter small permease subunit [Alphaproteobacteria bacterium]|nr:TRAP transporter small permease subunit [Alphaproteobacteria bacterium]